MMSDQNVEIFFYYIPFSRPNKNKEVVYKRFNKTILLDRLVDPDDRKTPTQFYKLYNC